MVLAVVWAKLSTRLGQYLMEGAKELPAVGLLSKVQPGVRLYDRRTNRERLVQAVELTARLSF